MKTTTEENVLFDYQIPEKFFNFFGISIDRISNWTERRNGFGPLELA